jgi:oxygen-dependent protoporphyrinogen oxidase
MDERDVVVVGGGVSGLGFAYKAAAAGREVLVLEGSGKLGGCLDTRGAGGFWFEMGAHTCYNSYRAFLELVEQSGIIGNIRPRSEVRKRFGLLRDGQVAVMGPLSVFLHFNWWELVRSAPRAVGASKAGQTVYSYYARLFGKRNYDRVLGPFLSAVPSQSADSFPAEGPGSLFKKRARRKEIVKSYTLAGGLGSVIAAAAGLPRVAALTGAQATSVERAGTGFAVTTADGRQFRAQVVALAVPASVAAELVRGSLPELAGQLARVKTVLIETLGVVVRKERVALPTLAFLVPLDDLFFSVVTRDVIADDARRGFAFHFRAGVPRDRKITRASEVLGAPPAEFEVVEEKTALLPSPVLGHADVVREIDRLLAGTRLAVTGNFFAGLAIEDCVERSFSEWRRVA